MRKWVSDNSVHPNRPLSYFWTVQFDTFRTVDFFTRDRPLSYKRPSSLAQKTVRFRPGPSTLAQKTVHFGSRPSTFAGPSTLRTVHFGPDSISIFVHFENFPFSFDESSLHFWIVILHFIIYSDNFFGYFGFRIRICSDMSEIYILRIYIHGYAFLAKMKKIWQNRKNPSDMTKK